MPCLSALSNKSFCQRQNNVWWTLLYLMYYKNCTLLFLFLCTPLLHEVQLNENLWWENSVCLKWAKTNWQPGIELWGNFYRESVSDFVINLFLSHLNKISEKYEKNTVSDKLPLKSPGSCDIEKSESSICQKTWKNNIDQIGGVRFSKYWDSKIVLLVFLEIYYYLLHNLFVYISEFV